jgi:hypothetical protein
MILGNAAWSNPDQLVAIKQWLDIANTIMLLAVSCFALMIVFRFVRRRKRKRVLEITEAILAPLLVITSQWLSPIIGDRIYTIKHTARTITQDQKAAFKKALVGVPRGPVLIRSHELDTESQGYMSDIRSLLTDAGFPGDAVTEMADRIMSDESVNVVMKDAKNVPPYAGNIQKALKDIGIVAPGIVPTGPVHWLKDGDFVILVNRRPD